MSLLNPNEQREAAQAPDAALVPNGIYVCRVSEVDRWSTGSSLVWKFRIQPGQECAGREVWSWTGLAAGSIFKTKEYMAALGFDLDAERAQIIGTPCKIAVAIEARSDTGEPSSKVKKVFPYDGPPLPPDPQQRMSEDPDEVFGDGSSSDEGLV